MATQCAATAKSTGARCRQPAVAGMRVCRYHGGRTPKGIASPHFAGKGYSKYLPVRMRERYDEARADPELIALADEIALVDARIVDLLGRVDRGESGRGWADLRAAWIALAAAPPGAERQAAEREVDALVECGHADYAAWRELLATVEQARRLKESERRRRVEMQTTITAHEALTYAATMAAVVKRHVRDADTLRAIADDWAAVTDGRGLG